jgi:hypothetical protein
VDAFAVVFRIIEYLHFLIIFLSRRIILGWNLWPAFMIIFYVAGAAVFILLSLSLGSIRIRKEMGFYDCTHGRSWDTIASLFTFVVNEDGTILLVKGIRDKWIEKLGGKSKRLALANTVLKQTWKDQRSLKPWDQLEDQRNNVVLLSATLRQAIGR